MSVKPDAPAVELAWPALRQLLHDAGIPFRLAGGLAVAHHGYLRTTEDIDILMDLESQPRLDPLVEAGQLRREADNRLRHSATGTRIDLLLGGAPMPRPGAPRYPRLADTIASKRDPDVLGLPSLVELKLHAHRHQDLADVVALLKPLDDAAFLALEAATTPELRAELGTLRADALEELSFES